MTAARRAHQVDRRAVCVVLLLLLSVGSLVGCGARRTGRASIPVVERRVAPMRSEAARVTGCPESELQVEGLENSDGILFMQLRGCGFVMTLPCYRFPEGFVCARWPEEVSASGSGS